MTTNLRQRGVANSWMIIAVAAITLFLVVAALSVWLFMQYNESRSDVDGKVAVAVAEAEKRQAAELEAKFQEQLKDPRLEFVGPSEYGRVSFMYPRTWSVYVDKDGSDRGDYVVYLHPVTVPPTSLTTSRCALRLEILNKDFDSVLKTYDAALKKGDLTSSTTEYNGIAATRLDGAFNKDLRGSAVLMRVRDKTIRFSTDADTFKPDFATILGTVKFVE